MAVLGLAFADFEGKCDVDMVGPLGRRLHGLAATERQTLNTGY